MPKIIDGAGSSRADPVIALVEQAIEAWNALGLACDHLAKAEAVVWDWKRKNPRPAGEVARRDWDRRHTAVELMSGHTYADNAGKKAYDQFEILRDELLEMRPATIEGLRAKARLARMCQVEDLN